jgi:hypothetical protein
MPGKTILTADCETLLRCQKYRPPFPTRTVLLVTAPDYCSTLVRNTNNDIIRTIWRFYCCRQASTITLYVALMKMNTTAPLQWERSTNCVRLYMNCEPFNESLIMKAYLVNAWNTWWFRRRVVRRWQFGGSRFRSWYESKKSEMSNNEPKTANLRFKENDTRKEKRRTFQLQ